MSKNQGETPALTQAIKAISDKISSLKAEVKFLDEEKNNQPAGSKNGATPDDLESELIAMKAEVDILKRSVPEGNSEDENVNFFLTVAELQKINEAMRQQVRLTEKNLQSTNQEIEASKSWISELNEMNAKIRQTGDHISSIKHQDSTSQEKMAKTQAHDLDNKIRATRKLYQEFKAVFAEYLHLTKPEETHGEDSPMAQLLQVLWDKFNKKQASENISDQSEDCYVKISFLEFDVQSCDVTRLLEAGIIEEDPNDNDRIRMVNFYE